jgi:AcrR family transcriptional regulator
MGKIDAPEPVADLDLLRRQPRPTESTRANSRAALVEAAFEEFSSKGYEAATVAGIAERAGVTTGALYAHFAGKLDLLLATVGLTPAEDVVDSIADLAALPWSEVSRIMSHGLATPPDRGMLLLLDVIVVARVRTNSRACSRCSPLGAWCSPRSRSDRRRTKHSAGSPTCCCNQRALTATKSSRPRWRGCAPARRLPSGRNGGYARASSGPLRPVTAFGRSGPRRACPTSASAKSCAKKWLTGNSS